MLMDAEHWKVFFLQCVIHVHVNVKNIEGYRRESLHQQKLLCPTENCSRAARRDVC